MPVSEAWCRVFGDNQDTAHGCLECTEKRTNKKGATAGVY